MSSTIEAVFATAGVIVCVGGIAVLSAYAALPLIAKWESDIRKEISEGNRQRRERAKERISKLNLM